MFFLLTFKKEYYMLLMEKRRDATRPSIFFKPQKFALQKGTVEHTSQSPACGAFLFLAGAHRRERLQAVFSESLRRVHAKSDRTAEFSRFKSDRPLISPSVSISFSWLPLTIDHPLSFSTCTLIGAWFRQRQIYKLIQLSNGASPIPPCNYNRGVRGESKDRLRNADGSKRTSRNSKQNW